MPKDLGPYKWARELEFSSYTKFLLHCFKKADRMSNSGESKVPPEPLDPRDNPKVLTVEDLEKAALGGPGGSGGAGGGNEAGNGGDGEGGGKDRQNLNNQNLIWNFSSAAEFLG